MEDPLGDGPRVVVSAAKNSNYKIGSDGEYYIYYGISAANLSDQEISLEGDTFVYTGKPIKPVVKILDKTNNKYLHSIDEWGTNDYEYKVEYTNNTDVGTATVTITGAPTRFKGTVTKTFQIVDQGTEVYSIADADVTTLYMTELPRLQVRWLSIRARHLSRARIIRCHTTPTIQMHPHPHLSHH